MAKNHVIVIHGGSCWRSYQEYIRELKHSRFDPDSSPRIGWQKQLKKNLGPNFKVFLLEMPNWRNAKYQEWKIWFEKAMAAAGNAPIAVVGHSLGAIFLAKYFAETKQAPKVKGIFLVSTPYKMYAENPDFGDFALKGPPHRLKKMGKKMWFYQSEDDAVVEPANLARYGEFVPEAILRIFKKRGHFDQSPFPELVEDIRSMN